MKLHNWQEVETPDISLESNMEHDPSFSTDDADLSADTKTANNILRKIRAKNANEIIFGTLNIIN